VDKYSFRVGPDNTPPLLVHKPLKDQSYWRWPPALNVYATDNVGIDRIMVYYYLNQAPILDSLQLIPAQTTGWYHGLFNLDTNQVEIGDTVYYKIAAWDKSLAENITMVPDSGYYKFTVVANGGEIVYDFEPDDGGFVGQGDWQWGIPSSGPRAALDGQRVWATQLDRFYSNGPLLSTLLSPPIDLHGFSVAMLQFWQWYDIKAAGDGGNIKISVDEGQSWHILQPLYGYDGTMDSLNGTVMAGEEVFYGRSPGWVKTFYNLDNYVGNLLLLKFDFSADDAAMGSGWYIDSVRIMEKSLQLPPPSNLTGLDNHDVIKLGWEYTNNFKISFETSVLLPKSAGGPANNSPSAASIVFNVYRQVDSLDFNLIGQTSQYEYVDSTVSTGPVYKYYLTTRAGLLESVPSDTIQALVQVVIGINNDSEVPVTYALRQNYPNPFNPVTVIKFELPQSGQVQLTVYDITGRIVSVLVNGKQSAGYHQVYFNAAGLSSGLYFYRIETQKYSETKKMVLIR
jgi:hypothetical protein